MSKKLSYEELVDLYRAALDIAVALSAEAYDGDPWPDTVEALEALEALPNVSKEGNVRAGGS